MSNRFKFTVFDDMLSDFHIEADNSGLIIDSLTITNNATQVTVDLVTPAHRAELEGVLLRAFGPAFAATVQEA